MANIKRASSFGIFFLNSKSDSIRIRNRIRNWKSETESEKIWNPNPKPKPKPNPKFKRILIPEQRQISKNRYVACCFQPRTPPTPLFPKRLLELATKIEPNWKTQDQMNPLSSNIKFFPTCRSDCIFLSDAMANWSKKGSDG